MKRTFVYMLILMIPSCKQQIEKPFTVSDLQITWSVIENLGGTYACSWKISNEGESTFPASGWTIYYNQVTGSPVPESLSGSLQVTQVSGTFYSITPTESFQSLGTRESSRTALKCFGSAIKVTDAPSGLYIVFDDRIEPQVVKNYEIGPFLQPNQMSRSDADNVPVPTTELRYQQNKDLNALLLENPQIVPTPRQVLPADGNFEMPSKLLIGYQGGLEKEAQLLLAKLGTTGQQVSLTNDLTEAHIRLSLGSYSQGELENYRLTIDPEVINIQGSDPGGVFYGTQSLISLWPLDAWKSGGGPMILNCQTVVDGPRFPYRGMYLDVSRNFQKPEAIKRVLDIMAFYKLNKFMFGLSNDEGWRLAIKGIPELTSVGAVRGHTEDELDHLLPAYGSGPFPQAEDNHGTGHYSREEFIDLLRYAQERHIEVIPEINFPGHARAAIMAMKARVKRLEASGGEEPTYQLQDPNDQSEYQSVQGYIDNVICPCQESVYQFLETIVAEVVGMYQEAGVKLTTIHTGGDEVPSGIWEKSPLCAKFLEQNPQIEGTQGLPGYFLRRYHEILDQHQLITAGWEEIAMHKKQQESTGKDNPTEARKTMVPNPEFADNNFLPYVWLATWGVAGEDLAYKLANLGYKVVMCNASNLYFDFAYDKDPYEPGFYWAGLVDTRKPYELVPLDVLQAGTVDIMGNPLDMDRYQDYVKLRPEAKKNILGIQGQLWSETVKGPEMLEYYLFPKMIGLAERAWAPDPDWAHFPKRNQRLEGLDQAWNNFANGLAQRELVRMDYLWNGVNYRLPLPGAIIEDGKLKANVAFPGLSIHYTLDGSEPNADSPKYEAPIEAKKPVNLKSFTSTGKSSRTSMLTY